MLENYIKIAWAILKRNKFFTFVSLFGISITLMILIVISALYDSTFGPYYPEKKLNRMLFVHGAVFTHSGRHATIRGSCSVYFLNKTVRPLKTPEMISITGIGNRTCYRENVKLDLMVRYTDENFWKILDFDFLNGKPFTGANVINGERVAIIPETTSLKYFDTPEGVGKTITIDGLDYRVAGVIRDVSINKIYSYGDIYLPYTTSSEDFSIPKLGGMFQALILARSKTDFKAIRDEYQKLLKTFPFPNPKDFNQVQSTTDSFLRGFISLTIGSGKNAVYNIILLVAFLLLILFMAFPAMNLMNINITRIIERASEIGVRKSFGASSKTLVGQFLVENILITLIGGCIGLIMGIVVIGIVNSSKVFPGLVIGINLPLFSYALLLTLVFGLLSGVYPAWRMSKLTIVNALKSEN